MVCQLQMPSARRNASAGHLSKHSVWEVALANTEAVSLSALGAEHRGGAVATEK